MQQIKLLVESFLGRRGVDFLRKHLDRARARKAYHSDRKRLTRFAFGLVSPKDQINLRGEITFYYHAIEKGLSNVCFRPGFGKNAMHGLFRALDDYINRGFDTSDIRFQTGISVIRSYIETHDKIGFSIDSVKCKYQEYRHYDNGCERIGGAKVLSRNKVLRDSNIDFKTFSSSRHSVRNFAAEPVSDELYQASLDAAASTPSVCNRQSWGALIIGRGVLQEQLLALQEGLVGFGQNIDRLILVYTDNRYFLGSIERMQGYVDGGLFGMSLLFALHSNGIATCMLNACMHWKKEREVRKLVGLPESCNIVMFIATGNYPENFKAPISKRDNLKEFSEFIQ